MAAGAGAAAVIRAQAAGAAAPAPGSGVVAARVLSPPRPGAVPAATAAFLKAASEGNLEELQRLAAAHEKALVEPKDGSKQDPFDIADADGRTALHLACKAGHRHVAEWLVSHGMDTNLPTMKGLTPFHFACFGGHLDLARDLAAKGANAMAVDKTKRNALHLAAVKGHTAVAQWLADPPQDVPLDASTQEGLTAVHFAAIGGHMEFLAWLASVMVETQLKDVSAGGLTALHHAVSNGWLEAAQYLVAKGCDAALPDEHGRTCLHFAVGGNFHEITMWLLQDVKVPANIRDNTGTSPLDIANMAAHRTQAVSSPAVQFLRRATKPPNAPSVPRLMSASHTALRVAWDAPASEVPEPPLLEYELQYGQKWSLSGWEVAKNGGKPLTLCTLFITELEPDTNYVTRVRARNSNGWGPWSDSSEAMITDNSRTAKAAAAPPPPPSAAAAPAAPATNGDAATASKGRPRTDSGSGSGDSSSSGSTGSSGSSGADTADSDGGGDDGSEPTKTARDGSTPDSARPAATGSSNSSGSNSNSSDAASGGAAAKGKGASSGASSKRAGKPGLELSTSAMMGAMVAAAAAGDLADLQRLLDAGADLASVDADGRTVVHHAALRGLIDVVQWLVNHGAPHDVADRMGGTPFLLSIVAGEFNCVKWLHSLGADVGAADLSGYGAVHYAALNDHKAILEWLLGVGADYTARAKDGKAPKDVVRSNACGDVLAVAMGPPPPPPPPTFISAQRTSVRVEWQQPRLPPGCPAVELWELQYGRKFSPFWETAASAIPPDKTTWTVTGLAPAKSYAVKVRAKNANGWGAFSQRSADMITQNPEVETPRPDGDGDAPPAVDSAAFGAAAAAALGAVVGHAASGTAASDAEPAPKPLSDEQLQELEAGASMSLFRFADADRKTVASLARETIETAADAALQAVSPIAARIILSAAGGIVGGADESRLLEAAGAGDLSALRASEALVAARTRVLESTRMRPAGAAAPLYALVHSSLLSSVACAASFHGQRAVVDWLLGVDGDSGGGDSSSNGGGDSSGSGGGGDADGAKQPPAGVVHAVLHSTAPRDIDVDERCAMHHAALGGHAKLLSHLLTLGGEPQRQTRSGATCLHLAAFAGHMACVELLLDGGAGDAPHTLHAGVADANGWLPLHYACVGGHLDVAKRLADPAAHARGGSSATSAAVALVPVSQRTDASGRRSVHFAAMHGDVELIEWAWTSSGGSELAAEDVQGLTPLHYAVMGGHADAVQWLLKHADADPNALDAYGTSPAMLAEALVAEGAIDERVADLLAPATAVLALPSRPAVAAQPTRAVTVSWPDGASSDGAALSEGAPAATAYQVIVGRKLSPHWCDAPQVVPATVVSDAAESEAASASTLSRRELPQGLSEVVVRADAVSAGAGGGDTRSVMVDGLAPGTEVVARVRVCTRNGWGDLSPFSDVVVIDT